MEKFLKKLFLATIVFIHYRFAFYLLWSSKLDSGPRACGGVSLCLSQKCQNVTVCQNVTKRHKVCQNVTKRHKVCQNVTKRQCVKTSQNVTKCIKTSQNITKHVCVKTSQSGSKRHKTSQNVSNRHKTSQCVKTSPSVNNYVTRRHRRIPSAIRQSAEYVH